MQQVIIMGAGNGGTAILKTLLTTKNVEVLGIVDTDSHAPGMRIARENKVATSNSIDQFLRTSGKKIVIDATGSARIAQMLDEIDHQESVIVPPDVALLIMNIVDQREELNHNLAEGTNQLIEFISSGIAQLETLAERNIRTLQETIAKVDNLTSSTENSQKLLSETGKILSMISNVADQTKMLGLNAAIEAARAGEHGRGFSVVADSIRELAGTSSESSSKVSDILRQIEQAIVSTHQLVGEVVKDIGSLESSHSQLTQELHGTLEEMDSTVQGLREITALTK